MFSIFKDFASAIWELLKLPFALTRIFFHRILALGWRKLAIVSVAAVILFLATLTIFFEATSQPGFCGSCHIMRPYIGAWEHSSHHDVSCMKCHARAGLTGFFETKFTALSMLANYATGLYKRSRPWAEIEDANCLQGGCHETRLLEGKINFTKGVVFDHTPHLTQTPRGRKLRCTSCHSQIVQGEHISVTSSTCFLCHFKNVKKTGREGLSACQLCHEPDTGIEAEQRATYNHELVVKQNLDCRTCHQVMWQGTGEVRRERCGTCHSSTAHIDRIDDLEFVHEWHLEKRKVDCNRCHDAIEHSKPELTTTIKQNCNSCHEGNHDAVLNIYQGSGSRLIESAMPDTMYSSGVVCMSCHLGSDSDPDLKHTAQKACTPCHSESYLKLVGGWKKGYGRRIAEIEASFKRAGYHDELEHARHDFWMVKQGGAWHNPRFADSLLNMVETVLHEAGARPTRSLGWPRNSQSCLTCHSSIADLPVQLENSNFDHRKHLMDRKISCDNCHHGGEPENPLHGTRMDVQQSCAQCHHNELSIKGDHCEPCHLPARSLYLGELPGFDPEPSPMAESEMTCTDCHESPDFQPPPASFCLDCHDQDLVNTLEFTRAELLKGVQSSPDSKAPASRIVKADRGRTVHHPDLARRVIERKK